MGLQAALSPTIWTIGSIITQDVDHNRRIGHRRLKLSQTVSLDTYTYFRIILSCSKHGGYSSMGVQNLKREIAAHLFRINVFDRYLNNKINENSRSGQKDVSSTWHWAHCYPDHSTQNDVMDDTIYDYKRWKQLERWFPGYLLLIFLELWNAHLQSDAFLNLNELIGISIIVHPLQIVWLLCSEIRFVRSIISYSIKLIIDFQNETSFVMKIREQYLKSLAWFETV